MMEPAQLFIPVKGIRSLCWQEDSLIDWAGGARQIGLDGKVSNSQVNYAYLFDAAVVSPSGRYAAIYTRLGTKALLLDNGKIIRELNRSFYYANAYEYPITLFSLPDGREVIAHCPNDYNRIDIEEIVTGKCLTKRETKETGGPFHSRLVANQTGTMLLDAGWIWQPYDIIEIFDVERALEDPASLDESSRELYSTCSEVSSAAFLDEHRIVLSSGKTAEDFGWEHPEPHLSPGRIAVYDLQNDRFLTATSVEEEVSTIMTLGTDYVVGFYEHPKLIHLASGEIVYRWPDVDSGHQLSSIIWGDKMPPHIALDPANRRFAVAGEEGIWVVTIPSV